MPFIKINNVDLYYEESGSGKESIVFSHSYLLNCDHFKYQAGHFKDRYRCIVYDHRGQGRSGPGGGNYDLETLYLDAVGIIESTGSAPCHFVGLSMGGIIGIEIALKRPDLLRTLVLMDTPAGLGNRLPESVKNMTLGLASLLGWRVLAGTVMMTMFGAKFRRDKNRVHEADYWKSIIKKNNKPATIKTAGALFSWEGIDDGLKKIKTPTLLIYGEKDRGSPVSQGKKIAGMIPGSRLIVIPDAGHVSSFEEYAAVNRALEEFWGFHH